MRRNVNHPRVVSATAIASTVQDGDLEWELNIQHPDGSMEKALQSNLVYQLGKVPKYLKRFWSQIGGGMYEENDTIHPPTSIDGNAEYDEDTEDESDDETPERRRRRLNDNSQDLARKRPRLSTGDSDERDETPFPLFRTPSPEAFEGKDDELASDVPDGPQKIDYRTREGRATMAVRREIIGAHRLADALAAPRPSQIQLIPETRTVVGPIAVKARIAAGIRAGSFVLTDRPGEQGSSTFDTTRRRSVITYDSTTRGMVSISRIYNPDAPSPSTSRATGTPQTTGYGSTTTAVDTPGSSGNWTSDWGEDTVGLDSGGDAVVSGQMTSIEEELPDFEDMISEKDSEDEDNRPDPLRDSRTPVNDSSQFGTPNVVLETHPKRWQPPPPPPGFKRPDLKIDAPPTKFPLKLEPSRPEPYIHDPIIEREGFIHNIHIAPEIIASLGLLNESSFIASPATRVKFTEFSQAPSNRTLNDPLRGLHSVNLATSRALPNSGNPRAREQIVGNCGMSARVSVLAHDNHSHAHYEAIEKLAAYLEDTNSYIETGSALPKIKLAFYPSANPECYELFLVPKSLRGIHRTLLVSRLDF